MDLSLPLAKTPMTALRAQEIGTTELARTMSCSRAAIYKVLNG
jgi:hypothetical protein